MRTIKKIGDEIKRNVKNYQQAVSLYNRYKDVIPAVLDRFDVEFSYREIQDAIYEAEAKCPEDADDSFRIDMLEQNLRDNIILHGNRSNIAGWILFATEYYRRDKNLSEDEVMELFSQFGVFDFISDCYPALHTVSEKYVQARIDEHIELCRKGQRG